MHPAEVKAGKTRRKMENGEQEDIPGLSELISQSAERKNRRKENRK